MHVDVKLYVLPIIVERCHLGSRKTLFVALVHILVHRCFTDASRSVSFEFKIQFVHLFFVHFAKCIVIFCDLQLFLTNTRFSEVLSCRVYVLVVCGVHDGVCLTGIPVFHCFFGCMDFSKLCLS